MGLQKVEYSKSRSVIFFLVVPLILCVCYLLFRETEEIRVLKKENKVYLSKIDSLRLDNESLENENKAFLKAISDLKQKKDSVHVKLIKVKEKAYEEAQSVYNFNDVQLDSILTNYRDR